MVVDRRHQEDAFFGFLIPAHLQHHRQSFHHKQAAHNHQYKFLPHDYGHRAQRRAQRQRAHVAHKHLRRRRVEPQKAQTRAAHGRAEHHHLVRPRHERQLQIACKLPVPGGIGKHRHPAGHQHHRESRQAVQAVGQIYRVGCADNGEIRQHHKAHHAQRQRHLLEKRHD